MDAASTNGPLTRTERLALRPLATNDVDVVSSVYGDPETMVTMPWRMLDTPDAARSWLDERLAERDRAPGYFVATDLHGELVGLCGFQPRGELPGPERPGGAAAESGWPEASAREAGIPPSSEPGPERLGRMGAAESGWLEVGWVIRKPHWGRGYATELTAAVLACAGEQPAYAAIRPSNVASIRVAEKVGLRYARDAVDDFGPLRVYVTR